MAEPLRHRQTKEAATDMFSLQPPRHIPTLPKSEPLFDARISASASYGHACHIGLGRLVRNGLSRSPGALCTLPATNSDTRTSIPPSAARPGEVYSMIFQLL